MNEEFRQIILNDSNLPSPPVIAVQILNAVQDQESGFNELSRIIATDPSLTGKMLQLANSGFYALNSKVTSIDRALTVLGTNVIKNIALSFVIVTDMRTGNCAEFDLNDYWRHSVTAAVAAELLTQAVGRPNENIFVTSLLHNIGMVVLASQASQAYHRLVQCNLSETEALIPNEQQMYGYDHQQVGALVVAKWGLPEQISIPIMHHHMPDSAPRDYRETTWIVAFADRLAQVYTGAECAEKVRKLQTDLSDKFSLSDDTIRLLLDQVAEKSIEILETFDIEAGGMKPYSHLLQEANEELGKLNLSYEQLVIELKEAKEKSERLARQLSDANIRLNDLVFNDSLTGLFNHRYFQQSLSNELKRAQRYDFSLSLILFDIDFFKKVNDTYGHPAGDQVLKNISKAIKDSVRPSDILARYGGEEFAVILPQTDSSGLKVFAARIRRCVEGVITAYEDKHIMVTISLGGTTFSPEQSGITKDILFETADRALYMSKNNGRNQVTILTTENTPSPL